MKDFSQLNLTTDRNNKFIVISGCSSGGKSSLLAELNSNGYSVVPEVGREIVKEQLALNGEILPWEKPVEFCEILIERSVLAYREALTKPSAKGNAIFFDRSILEGISYLQKLNIHKYDYHIDDLRYYTTIFMTPPWKEIFCEDDERKNTFENAVEEYERLVKCYAQYGYQVVVLPKISVKERCKLILFTLKL